MKRNRLGGGEMDRLKMARVLMVLSQGGGDGRVEEKEHMAQPQSGRVLECKTCSRRFPSFQALGGHRAKHKKPRPAGDGHGQAQGGAATPRVHECSICGLEFAVGQALAGHMRWHRAMTEGVVGGVDEKRHGCGLERAVPPLEDADDTKLAPGLEIADEIPMVNYLN